MKKKCDGCGGVGRIIHGAIGLAKAAIGIDLADEATIEARRAICRACPHAMPHEKNPAKFGACEKCGCRLQAKTAIASESCPIGKWLKKGERPRRVI